MDILKTNAFRILGLPVNATTRDIARREEDLQAFAAIEKFPAFDTDFEWIGAIDRSAESVRQALHVLDTPSRRLEHTLFWFWDTGEADRSALEVLKRGDLHRAFSIWQSIIDDNRSDKSSISAMRNLAVLSLSRAFKQSNFDSGQFQLATEFFGKSLASNKLYEILLSFAPQNHYRAGEIDLGGIVGNILYSSSKKFISDWLRQDDTEKVNHYLKTLSESPALKRTYENIVRDIISHLCGKIDERCKEMYDNRPENNSDAYSSIVSFYEEAHNLISRLGIYSPSTNARYVHYTDKVGEIMRDKTIEFGNKFEDWEKTDYLLVLANNFAISESSKAKIKGDIDIIQGNIKYQKFLSNLQPIKNAPSLYTLNGIGTSLYGMSNIDPESQSYETNLYFVIFFIPIFPIRRYRVIRDGNSYRFLGQLPFRKSEKYHVATIAGIFLISLIMAIYSNSGRNPYNQTINNSTNQVTAGNIHSPLTNNDKPPIPPNNIFSEDNQHEITVLKNEIDLSNQHLRQYETNLDAIRRKIKSTEDELQLLKNNIDSDEVLLASGSDINESLYRANINRYNLLADIYNQLLEQDKKLYLEYNDLLGSTNTKIDQYNKLIGAE